MQDEIKAMEGGQSIEMPILRLGVYHTFLQYYFKYFKRDQILIICTERMGRDTVSELRRVERFVGLRQHSWTQTETQKVFVGGYSEKIPHDAEDLLRNFYSNHNDALFSLLDEEFPWG